MDLQKRANILDVYKSRRYPKGNYPKDTVKVLLITNVDSDNLGDHVIEICDKALIHVAAKNLGFDADSFVIASFPLALIPTAYCRDEDPSLLENAIREISECTFVLFGGAPVFTFTNRIFYKKTATILSIAREKEKPVLFSAVGVDAFDDKDERCLLLKNELSKALVVRATTRDGIEHLTNFALNNNPVKNSADNQTKELLFPVQLVSDPAVYANYIFAPAPNNPAMSKTCNSPRIGIFVFRASGFEDNGVPFGRSEQYELWRDLCRLLDLRGYDYELLTSGHFADEAVLQNLIDIGYVRRDKSIVNINTPEELVNRIRSYDAVVSCRLHPSIISFSCGVPSIGIIWNSKVTDFYRHINYPNRALSTDQLKCEGRVSAKGVVSALEKAIDEGVEHNPEYISSVYSSLLNGIAGCLGRKPDSYLAYDNTEIVENLCMHSNAPLEETKEYVGLKFTRCYRNYTKSELRLRSLKDKLKNPSDMVYHSGAKNVSLDQAIQDSPLGIIENLPSGRIQYRIPASIVNNGQHIIGDCIFKKEENVFQGWRVRIRIKDEWFWLLDNGGAMPQIIKDGKDQTSSYAHVFSAREHLPYIPFDHLGTIVAEATWRSARFKIFFNSGRTSRICHESYDSTKGIVSKLESGSVEFGLIELVNNDGTYHLLKNAFSYPGLNFQGWRIRIKKQGIWFWLLDNGELIQKDAFGSSHDFDNRRVFKDQEKLPILKDNIEIVVAEAVWKHKLDGLFAL